ncbi:hypothetical protein [Alloalcanivorax balearicus]|uniref:hypothetical protein n=1 Tax=Alloalcanivorax balearicus TaxID=413232 RepID=UPI0021CD6DE2|nr:hypothetical protein [Alloalcanivorax balearicus]
MKAKIIMLSALGAVSFGLTQAASAHWTNGACVSGTAPCIEWNDNNLTGPKHFNGTGSDNNVWHGHPNGGDFSFAGTTVLSCPGLPSIECTLTLEGEVKKFNDGQDWRVGIRVNNSTITGGLLCGVVSVGGFPWYADETSEDDVFDEDSGIVWPGSLIGNFGNIDVSVFGGAVASNTHIHDVTYNNTDTFSFNGNLFENGTEVDTGCSVVGDLELQPTSETLSIN